MKKLTHAIGCYLLISIATGSCTKDQVTANEPTRPVPAVQAAQVAPGRIPNYFPEQNYLDVHHHVYQVRYKAIRVTDTFNCILPKKYRDLQQVYCPYLCV